MAFSNGLAFFHLLFLISLGTGAVPWRIGEALLGIGVMKLLGPVFWQFFLLNESLIFK